MTPRNDQNGQLGDLKRPAAELMNRQSDSRENKYTNRPRGVETGEEKTHAGRRKDEIKDGQTPKTHAEVEQTVSVSCDNICCCWSLRSVPLVIWSFMQFVILSFFFSAKQPGLTLCISVLQCVSILVPTNSVALQNEFRACPPTKMSVVLFLETNCCKMSNGVTVQPLTDRGHFQLFNVALKACSCFLLSGLLVFTVTYFLIKPFQRCRIDNNGQISWFYAC